MMNFKLKYKNKSFYNLIFNFYFLFLKKKQNLSFYLLSYAWRRNQLRGIGAVTPESTNLS